MLPQLLQNLTDTWRDPLNAAGIQLASPLAAIQLGGATGKDRKINYLVFTAERETPHLMMKIARTATYQERLSHEHEALTNIWQNPSLQEGVPRPLGIFTVDNNLVLLEQCLLGTSLKVLLRRRQRITPIQARQDCEQSINWLQKMQQATAIGTVLFEGETAVIQRQQHLNMSLPPAFNHHLCTLAEKYKGIDIPLCGSHGDYWPGNLLWHNGAIGVIDWEDFQSGVWPFHDFFLYFINYADIYPWQGWRWSPMATAFSYALLEQNWFADIFANCTQQYFQALDIPYEAASLFLSLFLMDQATPPAAAGQKRQQQAAVWQKRLAHYAKHISQSIFNRSIPS